MRPFPRQTIPNESFGQFFSDIKREWEWGRRKLPENQLLAALSAKDSGATVVFSGIHIWYVWPLEMWVISHTLLQGYEKVHTLSRKRKGSQKSLWANEMSSTFYQGKHLRVTTASPPHLINMGRVCGGMGSYLVHFVILHKVNAQCTHELEANVNFIELS